MIRPKIYTVFLALGAFVAGAAPFAVRAQSGDALAHAEQTCLDHGIGPYNVTFDTCVARAAQAYDLAEPGRASAEAQRVADARQTCLSSYDIDPNTLGFHQCVATESRSRSYAVNVIPDSSR
jgi:hypothetical protein